MKRSARQGMHENDMEAERVFKGAHCRTHLPTGDRLLHLLCAALGHLEAESFSLTVCPAQMA